MSTDREPEGGASGSRKGIPVNVPPQDSGSLPSTQELAQAIKTIRPVEDFKALPTVPCTRESLLYGIGTGAAIGGVRLFSARVPVAANWAVGTFLFVSGTSWYICQKAKEEEQRTAQAIVAKFPDRNMKIAAKRAALAREASEAEKKGSSPSSTVSNENYATRAPNDVGFGEKDGDTLNRSSPGGGSVVLDGSSSSSEPKGSSWWGKR